MSKEFKLKKIDFFLMKFTFVLKDAVINDECSGGLINGKSSVRTLGAHFVFIYLFIIFNKINKLKTH